MHATYFETTKQLTVTETVHGGSGCEPILVLSKRVPTRAHLTCALEHHGMRIKMKNARWQRKGGLYTAELVRSK